MKRALATLIIALFAVLQVHAGRNLAQIPDRPPTRSLWPRPCDSPQDCVQWGVDTTCLKVLSGDSGIVMTYSIFRFVKGQECTLTCYANGDPIALATVFCRP